MSLTPQQEGRAWEEEFSELVGGKVVQGSGNQWHSKLDVRGKSILWSCKWTGDDGKRITPALLQEAIDAVDAPGGVGLGSMPGLAIRMREFSVIVLRVDDFVELMTQPPAIASVKADNKRATARVPQLFREQND